MLPHPWQDLTYVQRAGAILHVYQPGMTTREIGLALGPEITRNNIEKVYRNIDWLRNEAPLPGKGKAPVVHDLKEPTIYPRHFTQEEADAYDATSLNMTCLEIAPSGDCRFPTGRNPLTFCGHNTKPGSVYCDHHHKRCYVPVLREAPKTKGYRL